MKLSYYKKVNNKCKSNTQKKKGPNKKRGEIDGDPVTTREGEMIYRYLVADKTGSVILSVWGEMGKDIKSGDILRISGV